MPMVQMNTRIDSAIKAQGDEVFATLGLSPSEVVRAVWGFAAEHSDAPAIVGQALALGNASGSRHDPERAYRVGIAKIAGDCVANYRSGLGLPTLDRLDTIDYRALREQAWEEKLAERGLS